MVIQIERVQAIATSRASQRLVIEVTSSCLCKKSEGAGFPFQVKAMEDGINYSIDTLDVYKANHWSGSAPHFDKTTLNDIGSPQLLPQMLWEAEKRQ